ncbi:hypothetical protein [Nocardioides sp. InS609-2]|uniref:hypothetical protein n=1 Tax=Nocardioides sp. InS609-2 TaxID=2760705 RepID=UPI0020C11FBE|nr:hypothetical protein [Nocardioides sp. InS609-2]
MKVRVEFTIEVEPAGWVEAYGVEPSEVRADVKDYAHTMVVMHLADLGVLR